MKVRIFATFLLPQMIDILYAELIKSGVSIEPGIKGNKSIINNQVSSICCVLLDINGSLEDLLSKIKFIINANNIKIYSLFLISFPYNNSMYLDSNIVLPTETPYRN